MPVIDPRGHAPEPARRSAGAREREREAISLAVRTGRETASGDPIWGAPPATTSSDLARWVRELEADLRVLAEDLRRGPFGALEAEARAYFGELRREFLRHHRRLVVLTRTREDPKRMPEVLRKELAELAERSRSVVLGRASRLAHEGWSPKDAALAIDRVVEAVPGWVEAAYEAASFEPRPGEPVLRTLRRRLLRARRRVARFFGRELPDRRVPLQELVRHHLAALAGAGLEGVASSFVQAEMQLVGRTRLILDGVVRGYEALAMRADDEAFPQLLANLRVQVEEELSLAEQDLGRVVQEGSRRATRILADGIRGTKAELGIIATGDLPARRRRGSRLVASRNRDVAELDQSLARVRDGVAATYGLLALHLEFVAYKAKVKVSLEGLVAELERDIRGRSFVQIERVIDALDESLAALGRAEAPASKEGEEEAKETDLEPVERVVGEAQRAARQLLEQLSAEHAVAPILDALNRQAQALTDRYRVPASNLGHAEWKLPPPVPTVEVAFADLVVAYVQTDIAPELLSTTAKGVETIQPLLGVLQELERVVTFSADQLDAELELEAVRGADPAEPDRTQDVLVAALEGSKRRLEELLGPAEHWASELGTDLRRAVLERLAVLRDQMAEGEIARVRVHRVRALAPGQRLLGQFDRMRGVLDRMGGESARRVRTVVGEERLEGWRRQLGLPVSEQREMDLELLAPPKKATEVPIFYRRLFAAQAYWAGDVLTGRERSVERARQILSGRPGAVLRTVALVGSDGSGKAALGSAVTRGDRWSSVRRINFSRPATVEDVASLFDELGQGQLIAVTGLQWFVSARPGGFEPLRSFLDGVVADGGRNAWLVEADPMVWRWAQQATVLREVFAEVVDVPPLDQEQLAAVILARHQLSGLDLVFIEPGRQKAEGTRRAEAAGIKGVKGALQQRFFRALFATSGGLLQVALAQWIAAVQRVDESQGLVLMGEVARPPHAAMRRLPDEILLTLYQTARQGWMDAATLAYLYRMEVPGAEAHLARLAGLGLLERQSYGAYQIRRHLRAAVAALLVERGWDR